MLTDAPDDRRSAARRDAGDGAGGRRARVRGGAEGSARLLAELTDDELLGYGVPPEWLEDVRAATEDSLFDLAGHLPGEAAEALLELATGGTPKVPVAAGARIHSSIPTRSGGSGSMDERRGAGAGARRSRGSKWTVFLHPAQREIVERRLRRAGAGLGLGRDRQDDRRAASRRLPGAREPRRAGAADDVLRHAGAARSRRSCDRLVGNEPRLARADRGAVDRRGRAAALRAQLGRAADRADGSRSGR